MAGSVGHGMPLSLDLVELAGKLTDALAAARQLRLLGDENGKAILNAEPQVALLAAQMIPVGTKSGLARVQGTTQDGKQIVANHGHGPRVGPEGVSQLSVTIRPMLSVVMTATNIKMKMIAPAQ